MEGTGNAQIADVAAGEVWNQLKQDTDAQLVDVRTRAEWSFVGLPDLSELGKRVLTVEWQTYPEGSVDPAFLERLSGELGSVGAEKTAQLFFICRSGARSRLAAQATAQIWNGRCWNVADGFEGPLDASRHRGAVAGWKSEGLPWVQG